MARRKNSNHQTMGIIMILLLLVTIVLTASGSLKNLSQFLHAQTANGTTTVPWLKTTGNQIQTQDGQQVVLRGVNALRDEWNGGNMTWINTSIPVLASQWHGNVMTH